MDDERIRFNQAMAAAVEKMRTELTDLKTDNGERLARIEQVLSHYSEKGDLIIEVIKEAGLRHEAQEKRHFEQMKLISDEHKKTSEKAFKAIDDIKTEQITIKARLKYAAGIAAAILFIVTFFKDPIVKAFTREQEPSEYRSQKHD